MVFIVAIHTDPFAGFGAAGNAANFLLESTARFAVPFFFVTAGYFFARKTATSDPTACVVNRVQAIGSLYVFGIFLSAPVFFAGTVTSAGVENRAIAGSASNKIAAFLSPVDLLYYGTSVSEILWFLPALAYSFVLIYVFVRFEKAAYLLPVSLGFHAIGLLGASYTMIVDVPIPVRDALFFGFFYTSLGYTVRSLEWRPSPERSGIYLGLTLGCLALHLGERYVLGYLIPGETFAAGVYSPSYTIGTALVTVSLFAFLLSRPDLGASTPLPSWGRTYAVGVYVAHPPVLSVLEAASDASLFGATIGETLVWHLVSTPATFAGALLVYIAAHKLRLIEIGESHLPRLDRVRNRRSI